MVGPNACTLQMDHLPTEDGGGSHLVDEWYDVVHFQRSSGTALCCGMGRTCGPEMPSCGRRWNLMVSNGRKLMSGCGSNGPMSRGDAMHILGSAATDARTMDGKGEHVGHGDIRERLRLPPDHRADIEVDQTQSTVVRSPRVSRVSIAHSRASTRLGRALQNARDAPRENGGRPSRSRAKRRIKSAQGGQLHASQREAGEGSGIVTDDMLETTSGVPING